ncbi:phosphate ABC transporter permease PstA [Stygiobacter electus]|uniref:Phosphate transport system permease protein PstA n=1 Tax=Stygiobacter electus TaxID=3032292 RepID=A0AAE3TCZ2_9BACT|nr:phosphate ABC transporter permease PstA [Stygiobacter electus]MDF1612913.1 phosphate ABC transporter permease PstA [Stygiobacter electus]
MNNKYLGKFIVISSVMSTLLILFSIIYLLLEIYSGGKNYLTFEFITSEPKEGMTAGGIFPAIVGTVLLVLIMSIICVPIGTITAIYLNEYANKKSFFTKSIRFAVNTLSGVPSIVFGLFGLGFFVQFIGAGMDKVFSTDGNLQWAQPNILWASFTMAFLTVPVVIVSVEEALKNVPNEYRAASLALGATKWETIRKIIIPNSISGILTGTILAVGRGAGEVAPILFTGAAYFLPHLPEKLTDQFMNLGYHVFVMSTQSTDVEATKGIQYATAFVLLILTFSLTSIAIFIRYKFRKKLIV